MQGQKEENKEKDNPNPGNLSIKSIKLLSQNYDFGNDAIFECFKILCREFKTGFYLYNQVEEHIWFSDELLELLNLPLEEQSVDKVLEHFIMPQDEVDDFLSILKEHVVNKISIEFNTRIKDNKVQRIFQNKLTIVKDKNGHEITLGVVKEITRQIQNEEELAKQKEKAVESDKIKSTFLKNISHEIRTPMNSVIGFIELLDNESFQEEKKHEFLNIIKGKSKQLLALIDDIAELSKFESGEIGISKTETNLVRIFKELHDEYQEKANQTKNNLEIFLNLPSDMHEHTAFTDPGRVQQVLSYLLDNALKYTEKGYIQMGYEIRDNKQIYLFVKDTGIGIPKEAQKYLFNRFRINEDTIESKSHNTGLGLTISRAIVEQLGGKINVESNPGQGSTFSFTIPYQKLEKQNSVSVASDEKQIIPNWRNKVIVVAEDDEVNYHFLEAVLADTQVRLIHVHNGKQAVEICQTLSNVDLILMDIRMPEKSGHEAVKEIKSFKKEIPIIAQTAYTGKEEREKCLQAGCDDYISKPIDISLLIHKINYFLAD